MIRVLSPCSFVVNAYIRLKGSSNKSPEIRILFSNNHKLDKSSKSKSNDNAFDENVDRRKKSYMIIKISALME